MAKSYEELQFTDDFMFGKVMEDKELCRDVLECLLQEPVGTLQDLYNYISKGKANSPLTRKIEAAVEDVKCNEKWRSEYMKELLIFDDYKREGREEGLEEGIEQGIEQGMQKAREDGIRIFIQDKLDDGIDRETILAKLRKLYALSTEEAEKYLLLFTPHSS